MGKLELDIETQPNLKYANNGQINSNSKIKTASFCELFKYMSMFDKVVIFFMVISSTVIGMAFPLNMIILRDVIDILLNPIHDKTYTTILGGVIKKFGMMASVTFIAGFVQMLCIVVTKDEMVQKYKHLYYSALLRQEIGWLDNQHAGKFISKMQDDIEALALTVASRLATFSQQIACFVISIIVVLVCAWKLALVGFIVIPIIVVEYLFSIHFANKYSIAQYNACDRSGQIAEEVIIGIRTVMAFNAQEKELNRYIYNLQLSEQMGIKMSICRGLGVGVVSLAVFSVGSLIFYIGCDFVLDGTYANSLVIQVFLTSIFGNIAAAYATPIMEGFIVAKSLAYPIFEVINRKPLIDTRTPGFVPDSFDEDIHFRNVNFEYPSRAGVPIIKDFNLTIPRGKTVAIIGPSGSGKSTIMNLLQRFYDPNTGNIFLGTKNLREIDLNWYRSHIGVVHQEQTLFTTSVEENIRLGRVDANFDDVVKASKDAKVYDHIMKRKEEFHTKIGEQGVYFSAEEIQLILFARVLIREPRLMLLDEATSKLDPKSEVLVYSTFNGKKTVVIVAHRLKSVKSADIIVVMNKGRIVEQGNHFDLLQTKGLYYNLLESQRSKESFDDIMPEFKEDIDENDKKRLSSVIFQQRISFMKSQVNCDFVSNFCEILKISKEEKCFIVIGLMCAALLGGSLPLGALIYTEMFKLLGLVKEPKKMLEERDFYCGLLLLPGSLLFVANFFKSYYLGKAGEALIKKTRTKLMENILKQDSAWFDKSENFPGILMAKLATDASMVKGIITLHLNTLCETFGNLIAALSIGFYYSVELTMLYFVFLPLIIFCGIIQAKMLMSQGTKDSNKLETNDLIRETLLNIRMVQSLGLQTYFSNKIKRNLRNIQRRNKFHLFICSVASAIGVSAVFYSYCIIFRIGGLLLDQNKLKMIALVKVFSSLTLSSTAMGRALSLLPNAKATNLAAKRTLEILHRVTDIDASPSTGFIPEKRLKGDIEFRDIYFRYPSRTNIPALRGLNLKVEAGQTVAIVGYSGSGKSTLIKLIERYYDPAKQTLKEVGQILLDGYDLKMLNLYWVRGQLGFVKQEPYIFNITVAENIAYGEPNELRMENVVRVAKMANIHNFIEALPEGYNTNVGENGRHLSRGEQQRICVARALYHDPSILLFDEATSSLDDESSEAVELALDRVRNNRTCINVAQNLSTIKNANQIVVMHNGNVLEIGSHEELMKERKHYFNLFCQDNV